MLVKLGILPEIYNQILASIGGGFYRLRRGLPPGVSQLREHNKKKKK
jgi:hypothetical protein